MPVRVIYLEVPVIRKLPNNGPQAADAGRVPIMPYCLGMLQATTISAFNSSKQ